MIYDITLSHIKWWCKAEPPSIEAIFVSEPSAKFCALRTKQNNYIASALLLNCQTNTKWLFHLASNYSAKLYTILLSLKKLASIKIIFFFRCKIFDTEKHIILIGNCNCLCIAIQSLFINLRTLVLNTGKEKVIALWLSKTFHILLAGDVVLRLCILVWTRSRTRNVVLVFVLKNKSWHLHDLDKR